MADGKDTQSRIDAARSAGLSDVQILQQMKESPKYKDSFAQARSAGLSDGDIAKDFGLNITKSQANQKDLGTQPTITFKSNNPDAMKLSEAKPNTLKSFALGAINDVGGGVNQGVSYLEDLGSKGINALLGTNLKTNRYDEVTKATNEVNQAYEQSRRSNGDSGVDFARLAGNVVASIPAGGLAKGFQGAKVLSNAGTKVLGQNAALGGLIGASQFAEDSGQRLNNAAIGAIGGGAGAAVGEKIGQGISKVSNRFNTAAVNLSSIDQKLDSILKQKGVNISSLSTDALDNLRSEAIKATKAGKDLDSDSVARQALLQNLGLSGTKAQVSRNPQQWQKESELAKIEGAGNPLRDKFVKDNEDLANLLNTESVNTGGSASDQYGAMQNVLDVAKQKLDSSKQSYKSLYDRAYKADGNDITLDGRGFANDAITQLDADYSLSNLPASIHKLIKDISDNPDRFTLGKSEELIRILNREYSSSLNNGQPTSATYAIGTVRNALNARKEDAVDSLLTTGGNDAASLYAAARNAYKDHAKMVDSMPLLQDAQKGLEPDKLFTKHILNGDISKLNKTIQLLNDTSPQAVNDIKQQIIEFISKKTINQGGDFSPAAMKRALDSLGERRLATMFNSKEIARLKDIGMAASYLKTQPAHSYVNNSNTSSALANFLINRLNLPGIRILASPVNDVVKSKQVSNTLKPDLSGADLPPSPPSQTSIDILRKAGLISGSNSAQE